MGALQVARRARTRSKGWGLILASCRQRRVGIALGVLVRPRLDDRQGERRPPRRARRRPRHRERRHGRAAPVGAPHRPRRRGRRHLHGPAALRRLPRGALDRDRPARAALRPLPAPALRLPRPGPDGPAHEPGQHGPPADPGLRGDDPADDLQRGHRPGGDGHPVLHRSGAHAARPRQPAVPQRARHPVLPAAAPRRDGHPAGVGGAGRGRGGDGRGRAGGQGLRRRTRPGRPPEGDGRRGLRPLDGGRSRPGHLPPGPRAAPEHRPDRHPRLRRPPGAQRRADAGPAGRLQRVRRDADLAAADARHDHRPGPAVGGGRRAGGGDPRDGARDRGLARPAARCRRRAPTADGARCGSRGSASRTRPSCRSCSTAST